MRTEQANATEHLRCLTITLCFQRKQTSVQYSYGWCCCTRSRGSNRISSSRSRRSSSGSNSCTAHETRAGSVLPCVCLVDQPPEHSYSYSSSIDNSPVLFGSTTEGTICISAHQHNQHRRNTYCTPDLRCPAMPVKSHLAACRTRCRTCLDELSTTYSEASTRRVVCYLYVHRTRRDWPWCRVR